MEALGIMIRGERGGEGRLGRKKEKWSIYENTKQRGRGRKRVERMRETLHIDMILICWT